MKPMYIRDDRIMPKTTKYARVVTFFHLLHLRHLPNVQASSQAGHLMIHLKMHRRDLLYRWFLAVHNSSIGDLVTDSVTESLRVLLLLTLQSDPRDL